MELKKILIQQLEQRPQKERSFSSERQLVLGMNRKSTLIGRPCLYYKDSGITPIRVQQRNGIFSVSSFFQAFKHAYTQHADIILVPDEIWIMISFFVSTYIEKHAQALRVKLVPHQGVQTITIKEVAKNQEESLLMEKNWDNFFEKVIEQIENKTNKGVVETFACDFSTTTPTYKIISTSIIMNSLKAYFNYKRMICACGINNVHMAGVREDWVKMITKLEKLAQYDVDGALKEYIEHMRVILTNFLSTFDEEPDLQWWNSVMKSFEQRQVYGGKQTDVDGWILHFFGIYSKETIAQFPQMGIKVPILMVNELTNKQKQLMLVSDWVSVSVLKKSAYKPDVGICILQGKETDLKKKN